jgi:hypothetical protein
MRLEQRGRVKPPYFEFNWRQEETREYGKTAFTIPKRDGGRVRLMGAV